MKKIIAILLAVIISAIPFNALAHSDNANAGTVPKTLTAPVIDGVKESLYDAALKIPVRNGHSATPDGGLGGGGDAWMLWDDEAIYVFLQIDLAGPTILPDDYHDRVKDEAQWEITTLEVLVDFSNAGESGNDVVQFRVDDQGYPNVTVSRGDGGLFTGANTQPYIDLGYVRNGNSSYTAELKIKYNAVRAFGEGEMDMDFGPAIGANKQIGLYIFSQECAESGDQALFVSVPTDQSGNWAPLGYDYIVLGANEVNAPAAPEPEAPAPVDDTAAGGGEENVHVPAPAPTPAPAPVAAPQTGDSSMIILILFALSFAGLVIYFKKEKV